MNEKVLLDSQSSGSDYWIECLSATYSRKYWFNYQSNESTWINPFVISSVDVLSEDIKNNEEIKRYLRNKLYYNIEAGGFLTFLTLKIISYPNEGDTL